MLIVARCHSSYEEADILARHIISRLYSLDIFIDTSFEFAINFCLRELLNNAVEHGNRFCDKKCVKLMFHYIEYAIYILVKDEGFGFSLTDALEQGDFDNITRSRGRGLRTLEMLGFRLSRSEGWIIAKIDVDADRGGRT